MTLEGAARMSLNILVLQQNLKNIESSPNLSRSAQYWDLFSLGPEGIVKGAKELKGMIERGEREKGDMGWGFGFEELKSLVELCYSEALQHARDARRESALQARRGLNEQVLLLQECFWGNDN